MATFKDLSDPDLRAELRRHAEAAEERRQREKLTELEARHTAERSTAERTLFATAVGEVTPLAGPARSHSRRPPPAPHPRQREADEAEALETSRVALNPSPMAWDIGLDIEGSQSFVRDGLNPDLLRKLRRGEWVVQGSLDLHQHTQDEARTALTEFLGDARRRG